MSIDEQVRMQFHDVLDPLLADVVPSPGLLDAVRRDHRRRRRLLLFAVPAFAAAATATAIIAATVISAPTSGGHTVRPGSQPTETASVSPSQPAAPGPRVRLFGHRFVLPTGFAVTHRSGIVDLDSAQPVQPVGGQDASFDARGPDGESLNVTFYLGAIAAAESTLQFPNPKDVEHTHVGAYPATFDLFAGGTLLETRVEISADELVLVQSEGMSPDAVRAMLLTGLE